MFQEVIHKKTSKKNLEGFVLVYDVETTESL